MKKLLFTALIVIECNLLFSQDCSKYIKVSYDKMTGDSTFSSKETLKILKPGDKTALLVYWIKDSNSSPFLTVSPINAGDCVEADSYLLILFKDGKRLQLKNQIGFNCDRELTI